VACRGAAIPFTHAVELGVAASIPTSLTRRIVRTICGLSNPETMTAGPNERARRRCRLTHAVPRTARRAFVTLPTRTLRVPQASRQKHEMKGWTALLC
jgi:hypothetical protein